MRCRKFLTGHIEWAKKSYWGKKVESEMKEVKPLEEGILDLIRDTNSISDRDASVKLLRDRVDYIQNLLFKHGSDAENPSWAWRYDSEVFDYEENVLGDGTCLALYTSAEVLYTTEDAEEWSSFGIPVEWLYKENIEQIVKDAIERDNEYEQSV